MHLRNRLFVLLAVTLAASCQSAQPRGQVSAACAKLFADPGFVDELDQPHAVCPDDQGKVSLVAGGTKEIHGIPDLEIADMFKTDEGYAMCRDLFAAAPFSTAMKAIAKTETADAVRKGALLVLGSAEWKWEPMEPVTEDHFTIYGCTDPAAQSTIHLYKTTCGASSIYLTRIGSLNLTSRFHLVAAHEIGHVIDHLAGPLPFAADPETRATIYGSFITQCQTRVWRDVYRLLLADPISATPQEEARRRFEVGCRIERWAAVEKRLAALRQAELQGNRVAAALTPLRQGAACAVRATDGRVARPSLDRCPAMKEKP